MDDNEDFKSSAYICTLNNKLYPCMQYILWGDPLNVDAMRTLYARRTSFPFNFIHPQKYMKMAEDFLETFSNFNIKDKIEFHNNTEVTILMQALCVFFDLSLSEVAISDFGFSNEIRSPFWP